MYSEGEWVISNECRTSEKLYFRVMFQSKSLEKAPNFSQYLYYYLALGTGNIEKLVTTFTTFTTLKSVGKFQQATTTHHSEGLF